MKASNERLMPGRCSALLDSLQDRRDVIIKRVSECDCALRFWRTINLEKICQKRSFFAFTVLLIGIQAVLGTFYVLFVPLLMPSDERAHLLYVNDLLQEHKLHKIYQNDEHYEAIQPPLYYALSATLCAVTGSTVDLKRQIVLLRFASFFFYLLSAFVVMRLYARNSVNAFSLSVCACYAWCPSLLGICCTITNDSLSFLFTAIAFCWFKYEKDWTSWNLVRLGLLCGLGLLTKLTFAAVIGVLLLALILRKKSVRERLKTVVCFSSPIVMLISPWIVWNLTTYGALQPYGSAAKWLVRGTFNIFDVKMYYPFVATFAAYHLSPSEFWLNQFHLPASMQLFLVVMMICAAAGTVVFVFRSSARNVESTVSFLAYFSLIAFWLVLTMRVNWEPVRGFLGGYFGFAYLMITGANVLAKKIHSSAPSAAIACFFPAGFLLVNIYLVYAKIPNLVGFLK